MEKQSRAQPDVEAIMSRIRREAKQFIKENGRRPAEVPLRGAKERSGKASPVLYSEELNFLNAHWSDWAEATEITSHRKFVGPVIVRIKRFFVDLVWNYLLKGYFERERQFQMHLVRFLNQTARYIDERDAEIFWELVRKVDADISGLNERLDRVYDEIVATTRTVEQDLVERTQRVEALAQSDKAEQARLRESITQLDGMIRGLERIIALKPLEDRERGEEHEIRIGEFPKGDVDYLLLENRFRGSEEEIRRRLEDYGDLLRDVPGPVIELGCGRGEFLEVLRDIGCEAFGVDLSEAMVACCLQKGLRAAKSDCIEYLEQLGDASIGAVFAAQLVEHLSAEQLEALIELSVRKVAPGGIIAFETINPQSVTALSRNFFRDPTHVWPLHPDTLRFMMEMKGIKTCEVLYRSPYPDESVLQLVEVSPYLPARWRQTLSELNDNVERLNQLLFGYQDYCIVGRVDG